MTATETRLKAELAKALRAKGRFTKSIIRTMLAAVAVEEVTGKVTRELSDDKELAMTAEEHRKRLDSATTRTEARRSEPVEKENAETEFMAVYLSIPLTDEGPDVLVKTGVAEVRVTDGTPTMKHMGALVEVVNAAATGRAPGTEMATRIKAAIPG